MTAAWTFPAMVDALKVQLEALPEVTAFDPLPVIRVYLPDPDEGISDAIILGLTATDFGNEQAFAGSNVHDEEVSIGCRAWAIRYGTGEDEALAARDRVLAYVRIVDEQLRTAVPQVGLQTVRARVEDRDHEAFPGLAGEDSPVRYAAIDFNINYRARTTP